MMKRWKRIFGCFAVWLFLLTCAGACGGQTDTPTPQPPNQEIPAVPEDPEEPEIPAVPEDPEEPERPEEPEEPKAEVGDGTADDPYGERE